MKNHPLLSCELADGFTVSMSLTVYADRAAIMSDDRAEITVVLD